MQQHLRDALDRLRALIEGAEIGQQHRMASVEPLLQVILDGTESDYVKGRAGLFTLQCRHLFNALSEGREGAGHRIAALATLGAMRAALSNEQRPQTESLTGTGGTSRYLGDQLTALLAYWRSKCSARGMPARRDIDPSEIPKLLPSLILIDVQGGQARYRLVSERIENAYAAKMTGRLVQEIVPRGRLALASRTCSLVWGERRPLISYCPMTMPGGKDFGVTRLMLPLSNDGREVNMILTGVDFPDAGPDEGPPLAAASTVDAAKFTIEMLRETGAVK